MVAFEFSNPELGSSLLSGSLHCVLCPSIWLSVGRGVADRPSWIGISNQAILEVIVFY